MKRPLVYIAGPISKGPLQDNINRANDAFFRLVKAGVSAIAPQWSCYSGPAMVNGDGQVYAIATTGGMSGISYENWMMVDVEIVLRCDGVLRLDGESQGADIECGVARGNHIPVFHSVDEALSHFSETNFCNSQ